MIVIGILIVWLNWRSNKQQCDELLGRAQTHSDSLIALASRPVHNGLSCQQLEDWKR